MKSISCRDAGFNCDHVVKGETEEEILRNGMEHAKRDHNMKEEDFTPEMQQKMRNYVQNS